MPIIQLNGKELEVSDEIAQELNTFVSGVNQKVKDKEELLKIGDSFGVDTKEFKTAREAKLKILKGKGFQVGDEATEDYLNGALEALSKVGDSAKEKKEGNIFVVSGNLDDFIEDIFESRGDK